MCDNVSIMAPRMDRSLKQYSNRKSTHMLKINRCESFEKWILLHDKANFTTVGR